MTARVQEEAGIGGRILVFYRDSLTWALDHRGAILGGTVGLFVVVVLIFAGFNHGTELFPETDPRQIWASVETPPRHASRADGRHRARARTTTRRPARHPGALGGLGSRRYRRRISGGRSEGGDPTRGRVTLDLLDMEDRSQGSLVTLEEARRRVRGIPGATINVERPVEGPPVGDPLSIEVAGDDFGRLGEIAERIQREIADIPGLATLDNDFDLARPEVIVRVDRDQAARLGLSTALIARTLRTAVNGTEASQFHEKARTNGTSPFVRSGRTIEPRRPAAPGGGQRRRRADPTRDRSQGRDRRSTAVHPAQDRRRVVTIAGKVTTPERAQPVRAEAEKRIQAIPGLLPPGYSVRFAGQSQDEEESTAFL